jgi:flagellar motor protein MotB
MSRTTWLWLWIAFAAPAAAGAADVVETAPGEAVERHLPSDESLRQWVHDPELIERMAGDRLEQREVLTDDIETVKLKNVIPAIRFESGVADIPPSAIQRLRGVLDSMRHLENVRLHLVGHADDQPLSDTLAGVYGDNAGLSRERAGEVAEFLQTALGLPPEAISFEWAGDSQPIASNATPEGRALNRRVEVEVWYDEIGKKLAVEEVVVPEEIKRVKICRMETVCKLRYREGHSHRARVRNLVPPLHFGEELVGVPEAFVEQIRQALQNLGDRQNVAVKLIGFTDDAPLEGRAERIYGTHLALSKARAHRVALALQEALDLPSAALQSEGRGAALPIASNETEQGRALNRRVEVEFWHDDPLQELPDEPQICPEAAGAELVTRVYDPPWGRIAPLQLEGGNPVIPPGYGDDLRRAMEDLAGETHVRLRFVGYTGNERLDRRTALVYGDDIGLSAARARRAMERIQEALGLSPAQVEHEGRGYVQSNDVVNAGFLAGEDSTVEVQVVYDELAVLDDYEGVEVTRITRELKPKDPLALNLMRISVDGEPIDDPGRSSADVQRCTDVALERTDVQFRFDNLEAEPRLSVTSWPATLTLGASAEGGGGEGSVRFRAYSNYWNFIERSEVRVFREGESTRAEPLDAIEVGRDGLAEWRPAPEDFAEPLTELEFVLRAYDADGRFDETAPQPLWVLRDGAGARSGVAEGAEERRDPTLAGYGESGLAVQNIPIGNAGSVRVQGRGIPPRHTVWFAGDPVAVDEDGSFVAEALLPTGLHTVEVAVLDEEGNGELFLRDLEFERDDWFYVGVADVTLSMNQGSGASSLLEGQDAPYDPDSFADGRLAFYVSGKFWEDWGLTASADTREGSMKDLFTNFMDKSPEALFRRIDPDYHYPTFGDDGTVEETAPTSGKFYLKLNQDENHALWGNFKVGYLQNELAHVDRGLYGANLHFQSDSTTTFGEQRMVLDGFAAEPGTVASRQEFRSTGGSLYFLRHQDLLAGSERVRIEVRDKDSGLVSSVVHLQPSVDYDIDYLQGRVLLAQPIGSTVADGLLVRSDGSSGNETWLVVQYEFTPGFNEMDALAAGGQGHYWLNEHVKLGLTANRNEEGSADSGLYAGDVTLRMTSDSWLKLQAGRSQGLVSSSLFSEDGGFQFFGAPPPPADAEALAYRADLSVGFSDLIDGAPGQGSVYVENRDAGYSAPGMTTFTDTQQLGGSFTVPVLERLELTAKGDRRVQDQGLQTTAGEVDVGYRLTDRWRLGAGVRTELRDDDSPIVPVTQEEGARTDAVVQVGYEAGSRWRSYAFGQATLARTGSREQNRRGGIGGAYRLDDRTLVEGEVSHGDLGPSARLGTRHQQSKDTDVYLSYVLENERTDSALFGRRGNLISGARTRLSDSSSVYMENRFQHSGSAVGLSRAMGINLAPAERWSVAANWENGTLVNGQTNAETQRRAGGGGVGYASERLQLSTGVEYRFDESEQLDGTWSDRKTWLFRNSFKFQVTPGSRLLGKFDHSFSDSSLGQFYGGGFTEAVVGHAYRPVQHDRLFALTKYTYFFNVPTTDQVTLQGTSAEFLQQSHVLSLDLDYDLTANWSVGGKYAYRLGQVSLDRVNPDFVDNSAHLSILRTDLRVWKHWEGSLEGRMLDLPDLDERRAGAVLSAYRYLGDHFKVGVGYNFTDFSDDLTDLSYDHQGVFVNLVGSM